MTFSKSGASLARPPYNTLVTVAGSKTISNVQNIGTGDETLDLGDVGTIGYAIFNNLDDTNYIDIGADGSSYPIRVQPGKQAGPIPWNGAAIHAKANTGACDLQYDIVEA
jgi:hypothetical protein